MDPSALSTDKPPAKADKLAGKGEAAWLEARAAVLAVTGADVVSVARSRPLARIAWNSSWLSVRKWVSFMIQRAAVLLPDFSNAFLDDGDDADQDRDEQADVEGMTRARVGLLTSISCKRRGISEWHFPRCTDPKPLPDDRQQRGDQR